ncbi:MAG: indole-3-glycerol phosphate synthase TrpC, partial [Dehalococcoidia bacterium]|nr:indole-3-glycerol phosphate synthase TrpC [Dehalococcoidia bacterium]
IIAEIKRASPSKGPLNPNLDVAQLAKAYKRGGAVAISVLTEPTFFKGSFADLETARKASGLPVLRKDFILEPVQVYEARSHGADAVLLIVAITSVGASRQVGTVPLRGLRELAASLGMAALVEVHNELEMQQALESGATLIGINNRNLVDFTVDINTTFKLRTLIPQGVTVVSESGISTPAHIARLRDAGVNAVLIGEALVTSKDPEQRLRGLLTG